MESEGENMRTNLYYAAAAGLMWLTVLIHIFGGGPEVHTPIQASDLSPIVRGVAAVIWHAITWILILLAVAIGWLSRKENPALNAMVIATQLGFSVLFVYYGLTLLGTLWLMPQWTIFTGIPVLMMVGQWRHMRTEKPDTMAGQSVAAR